ncbi:MAG TPA: tetratricopeptide repeat protein, partial [Thermoleophilaceae bacterium]
LGAAAFALLGLAAGLAPRRPATRPARVPRPRAAAGRVALATGAVAGAMLVSLGLPYLSERYVSQARDLCCDRPAAAFDKLDTAASLNPLSPDPKLWQASIALFLHRPRDAERYFRQLLDRDPGDFYAHLMLGGIAFDDGRRAEGLRLLKRAEELNPRNEITQRAVARARRGRRVDVARVNRAIGRHYRRLGQ